MILHDCVICTIILYILLFFFCAVFSVDETPFRGFFVQSRTLTNQFTPDAPFVGGFVNNDQFPLWQIRPCDGVDVMTKNYDYMLLYTCTPLDAC